MIPKGWIEKNVCEVCDVYQPQTISGKELVSDGKYKVYGANGIIGFYDKFNHAESEVLLGCRGSCGAVNMSCPEAWINGNAMVVRPKQNKILKQFLKYFLLSCDFSNYISGTATPQITRKSLSPLKIYYPESISEQQQIVDMLDTLFADIEKEKQVVQQNLQNAKELFESELNALLTSNTDNWTEKSLNDVCKTISAGGDKPLVCSDYETELCKVPIYSNGVANNGLYGYTDKPTVFEPAITVSARGTIGFVCKREQPFCPIVRLITLVPKEGIDLSFFAYVLKLVVPQNTGSSIPQLTVPNLKPQKIKFPDLATQKVIAQKLDTLHEQTQKLEQIYTQQIADLDELKQAILKKAFNGEL